VFTVHIRNEQFFCDQCSFNSHSKQCLDVHIKNKHDSDKPKYKCEICGVQVNYMDSYRTHMRRHYDEKPYKCDQCDRCFTSECVNVALFLYLLSALNYFND
jgi:KRAB domain-containing zinc finger protein